MTVSAVVELNNAFVKGIDFIGLSEAWNRTAMRLPDPSLRADSWREIGAIWVTELQT